ncbi:MAG TPA: cytochrome c [Polyangia bacterium]
MTKRPWGLALPAFAAVGLACAANQKVATIEPTPIAPEPATPSSDAIDQGATGGASGEDMLFVLSRVAAAPIGATTPAAGKTKGGEFDWIHVGDKWWSFRGEFLRLAERDVRTRDDAIEDDVAPANFWDRQTAVETALIWTSLCNECHGGRRKVEDALEMPPPRPTWGRGKGLFFGQARAYKEVFGKVFNGGGPPKEDGKRPMPPWRGKLAREQIWALLYFLEYQSGGIEGRFPPSLYPRMPANFPAGNE